MRQIRILRRISFRFKDREENMLIKCLTRAAILGLVVFCCSAAVSDAQDWNGQSFPHQYYGQIEGAPQVYLYSSQYGWRLLPVVRNGQLPSQYPQPMGRSENTSPQGCCTSPSSGYWTGYRSFWVPLNEAHLYQNDPRFRVVTPIPKEQPVAPKLPPKPDVNS